MLKLSAISPRTNAFMSPESSDTPEESAFSRIFTNLSYGTLETKAPKSLREVITFKILEADLESGTATGVFICQRGKAVYYIPMVLTDSTVVPPEMLYSKEVDAFLPLKEGWLDELQTDSMGSLGSPSDIPEGMSEGLNLSGILSPPSQGRVSYASFSGRGVPLVPLLERSPNTVKKAFATFLRNNPSSLDTAIKYHGPTLVAALQEKTAEAVPQRVSWAVLTTQDSSEDFRTHFGSLSGDAFKVAAAEGSVIRDTRSDAGIPIRVETQIKPLVPGESGGYRVIDTKGSVHSVAVFVNPSDISGNEENPDKYLVLFEGGDFIRTKDLVALDHEESLPRFLSKALSEKGSPLKRGRQILVKGGKSPSATLPVGLSSIAVSGDTERAVITGPYSNSSLVRTSKAPMAVPHRPKGSKTVFVPAKYTSVPVAKERSASTLVTDATTFLEMVNTGVAKLASRRMSVKSSLAGEWSIDGKRSGDFLQTVRKMASEGLRADASAQLLKDTPLGGVINTYVVPASKLSSVGSIFAKGAQMDPSMMGGQMDPSMMGAQVNPQFMQDASALNDQGVFDVAAAASVLQSPDLRDIVSSYLPDLQKSLDSLGRILLAVGVRKSHLVEQLGEEEYSSLRKKIKRVFNTLGDIVLKLDKQNNIDQDTQEELPY